MSEQDGHKPPPDTPIGENIPWRQWLTEVWEWFNRIGNAREDNIAGAIPTDAELDTAFGTPASVGDGYVGILDDSGAGTSVFICVARGTTWQYVKLTKAT